jgi:tetratricopeptide (TPR) repeat protein
MHFDSDMMFAMLPKALLVALLFSPALAICSIAQTPPGNNDQVELHNRLAQQYLKEQRPDLAIPELEKVIAFDSGNTDAQGNLGVLLFFRGDYKSAVPHLRAAVQAQPNLWKIQALLGLAKRRTNENKSSHEDLEAALPHLQGEKIQADVGRVLIDDYTVSGDLEKAASTVSTLLSSQPTDPSLLYMAYRIYSDLAGKAMLTLALSSPGSAQMHQVMARELARHGDDSAAISNDREALKIDPKLPELHSELGDLLYNSSDEKLQTEAESEFEAALAANPNDARAQLMLGIIAAKHGDLKTAYANDSHAVELQPNDGDAYTELGKILILMNEKDKARQMFEHAIQIDPTNYVAHYRLSTLYRQEGKHEEAKQEVAEYLKYKQMKDKLEKIFHDMRVLSPQHTGNDDQDAMR